MHRDFQLGADLPEKCGGFTVGCVTLVCIDLDDRPGIKQRSMVFVMLGGKVRVHAMGAIRGNHHGALDKPRVGSRVAGKPLQHAAQERSLGTCRREATDFLVVVTYQ